MRKLVLAALVAALAAPALAAPIPPGAKVLQQRIEGRIKPDLRAWAANEAQRVADGTIGPERVNGEAARMITIPAGADIQELAFIVLMQAANDADADLARIMAETKAQQQATNSLVARNMSQAAQVRLQMLRSRRAQMEEEISNILQKLSDTDQAIIKNLK